MTALQPVRLEGSRVVVRSSAPGDEARFLAYFERNRAHLEPWEPERSPDFYTPAYWQERIREHVEERERGTMQRMCFFEKPEADRITGMISLVHVLARAPVWNARVGYSIDVEKEGRGLVSQALDLVVRYAFGTLNLKRLLAGHLVYNVRSSRVLERAGFVREAYQRDFFFVGGRWEDHIETSLINPAWRYDGRGI